MPLIDPSSAYNSAERRALDLLAGMSLQPDGADLIHAGQVHDIVHTGVVMRIFLNTDALDDAQQEMLAESIAPLLKDIPGVERVIVKPRPQAISGGRRIDGIKRVVAVHSGKGGVGKSTLTAQLALILTHLGIKVGILDADIYGPSLPILFGAHGPVQQNPDNQKMTPLVAQGIRLMSLGFLLPDDQALVWRGSLVDEGLSQFFTDVDWGELDLLLVDLPPGTSDVHLAALRTTEFDGVITVTAPGQVSLDDVRRGMEMFADLAVPCLGLVENMAGVACSGCQQVNHLFGELGGSALAQEIGVPLLASIPFYPAVASAADYGTLSEQIQPGSDAYQVLSPIVERLCGSAAGVFPELRQRSQLQSEVQL
tara:strand:+ start:1141 stop:2244 length:1104 start_codon:yes stop_codon:yes gene_type:complete